MGGVTRVPSEPRRAMMALARVTWEDQDGTVHTFPARIEDMSPSGACIRLKILLEVGSRIRVTWCRDEFTATTKWCRSDELDYVIGMQRDRIGVRAPVKNVRAINATSAAPVEARSNAPADRAARSVLPGPATAARAQAPAPAGVTSIALKPQASPSQIGFTPPPPQLDRLQLQTGPTQPQTQPMFTHPWAIGRETAAGSFKPASSRPEPAKLFPAVVFKPGIGFEIAFSSSPRKRMAREGAAVSKAKYQKRTTALLEERTHMPNKWLNLGSRRQQQEASNGNSNGAESPRSAAPEEAAPAYPSPGAADDAALASPQGDLLPLEDIYRSAGIVGARLGYSVHKVIDMLGSDHLRGLSDDVKRASVLMALSAAGIPLGDVLQDAVARQAAVTAYEAGQKKKFEEYWSRRAEENALLQAEVERITRQYVERMNRNLNEVEQEKRVFQKWQEAMQQEVLQISEAVALCAPSEAFETPENQRPGAANGHNLVANSA